MPRASHFSPALAIVMLWLSAVWVVAALRPPPASSYSEPTRTYTDRHGNASIMRIGGLQRRELPPIAGHIPDRKPLQSELRPKTGSCGLVEAAEITGFDAKRMKAFVAAGEVPKVEYVQGRPYFDHEGLAEWMASEPPARLQGDKSAPIDAGTIPVMTEEQDRIVRTLFDLFATLASLGPARDALGAWGLFRGQDIAVATVADGARWLAEFAADFPAVDAERQIGVEAMLRKVQENVIA